MKTSSSIALTTTLSLLSISSAFAAGMTQTVEPSTGFMKGQNPEWSTAHTASKQSNPAHRLYHKNVKRITPDSNRASLRQRNMMHRQWHLESADADSVQTDVGGWKLQIFFTNAETTIVPASGDIMLSRTLFSPAPSRRLIVEAAEERNKIRAASVGQQ